MPAPAIALGALKAIKGIKAASVLNGVTAGTQLLGAGTAAYGTVTGLNFIEENKFLVAGVVGLVAVAYIMSQT